MKTKEEVIKALELCADPEGKCGDCSYENGEGSCMSRVMRDAAELLKGAGDGTSSKLDSGGA